MNFTVIIPSRSASNLIPCVEAVRKHEPAVPIMVVDDGVDWDAAAFSSPLGFNLRTIAKQESSDEINAALGLKVIPGVSPFIFSRNCNLGIAACTSDVVLLNDDALLETPFGFHELEEASQARPEFGVISAVTNVTGNLAQQPKDIGLREEPRTLCFVCVYIPRATLDRVGPLDERFTAYGWEDNDYCRRVREAGLKLGILDDCYVNHGALHSTFRGGPRAAGDIGAGREIYLAKWGDTN